MPDFLIVVRVLKGDRIVFEHVGSSSQFAEVVREAIAEFRLAHPGIDLLDDDVRLRFEKA